MNPGGTLTLAGGPVSRLGLGTMSLTGPGHWGPPADPATAVRVLQDAVHQHGISHLDTADAYGPGTAEELIRQALHPYPDGLLIATKVGMIRPAPRPLGRPDYLRAAVEASLRRLGVEQLRLCYLHRIDPAVPLADQIGELRGLQEEGKIGHIGLSKVAPEQIRAAAELADVAAVQNLANLNEPQAPAVGLCAKLGIPYVPYRPLDAGKLAFDPGFALSWLLALGGTVAPIPSTSNPAHLAELAAAAHDFTP